MRDSKLLLPVASLFFLLVSFALVLVWGYRFFYEKKTDNKAEQIKSNTKSERLDSTLDDAKFLKTELDGKLSEFQKLKNEISALLRDPSNQADLNLAKRKMDELQRKIDELNTRNTDIVMENKRLNNQVVKLLEKKDPPLEKKTPVNNVTTNTRSAESIVPVPPFMVSEIRLTAVKADEDQETSQSQQAEKLVGSFTVKNNLIQFKSAELIIVVLQPNGAVLQSDWESGSFDTKQGRRTYSSKIKFEYTRGEAKRLQFALSADHFQRGDYTMQVYSNGIVVGRFTRRLT